ncbi:hypothetical protein NEMBOFW57_010075 [Staphylotrichum longicolle]|uniref:Elongin-C n=1 Tax=Staphylotrichum longicolle TaxID=669026 RepID=A0AAD4EQ48_9PEZI|nr:hypothetical protein NEMBOFW57_010075 [Staphylotrichum longicolle]
MDGRQNNQVVLTDIDSAVVLEKVVEYFHYWYRNRDREDVPDMDIPVELCLQLLEAAEYFNLDAKPALRDLA